MKRDLQEALAAIAPGYSPREHARVASELHARSGTSLADATDANVLLAVREMNADPAGTDPARLVFIAKRVGAPCDVVAASLARLREQGKVHKISCDDFTGLRGAYEYVARAEGGAA